MRSVPRAASSDQEVALAQGVSVGRVFSLSWALAAMLAGLAGVFLSTGIGLEQNLWLTALKALPGVGEWTAQYIAMRALREPDAFPAADVGLMRALTPPGGSRPSAAEVLARAEAWRPWRAYACFHLWASLAQPQGETHDRQAA